MDLTVEGKLYHDGAFETACLGIENGKIAAIKKILKSEHHLNVGGSLLLPAGIDLHVHFRDPGFTGKEDFSTGSLAAAFGGISCVCDMPNTNPQTTSVQALKDKTQLASAKSHVDFGLHAGVTDENLGRLSELAAYCSGYKIYLGSSTVSSQLSSKNLAVALRETGRTKKPTLIHAEDEHCLGIHQDQEMNLVDHVRCRPAECEETAVRHVMTMAQSLSSPIHICHLSSCEGLEMLRTRPKNLSVGVTPHHLFFDVHKVSSNQTFYKVNPPIRSSFDKDAFWAGVTSGFIDVCESDHAPHTLEEKQREFNEAPSGLPGVETMYPVLLAAVKKERLSFPRLLSMLCERPAQLLSIPKGRLEVGLDADFIVVDFKTTEPIKVERLHSKCGWTPFEGYPADMPSHVFIRGEKVIENHELLVKPGFGKNIGAPHA
jgi:dihydroorotase